MSRADTREYLTLADGDADSMRRRLRKKPKKPPKRAEGDTTEQIVSNLQHDLYYLRGYFEANNPVEKKLHKFQAYARWLLSIATPGEKSDDSIVTIHKPYDDNGNIRPGKQIFHPASGIAKHIAIVNSDAAQQQIEVAQQELSETLLRHKRKINLFLLGQPSRGQPEQVTHGLLQSLFQDVLPLTILNSPIELPLKPVPV